MKLDEIMDYSPEAQILSKKLGDASQSLSCCKEVMHLIRFLDNDQGYKNKNDGNVVTFDSNGCHAFCSYDRIAYICALNYNCPIIFANTLEGITIFVRKDLIDIMEEINTLLTKSDTMLATNLAESFNQWNSMKNEPSRFKNIFDTTLLNLTIEKDSDYHHFMLRHFLLLPALQIYASLHTSIREASIEESALINDIITEYNKITDKLNDYPADKRRNLSEVMNHIRNELMPNEISNVKAQISGKGKDDPVVISAGAKCQTISKFVNFVTNKAKFFVDATESIRKIGELLGTSFDDTVMNSANLKKFILLAPKGITTNILQMNPYTSAITSMKAPRSSDVFFERSTVSFGTTTSIIPICNALHSDILCQYQSNFFDKINGVITATLSLATTMKNLGFESTIAAAQKQLATSGIKSCTPAQASDGEDRRDKEIEEFLIKKNLLVKAEQRLVINAREMLYNVTRGSIEDILNNLMSSNKDNKDTLISDITISYELDKFLRGFVGLITFLCYLKSQEKKTIPSIFRRKRATEAQALRNEPGLDIQPIIFKRLFELSYKDIDSGDDFNKENIFENIEDMKKDINAKVGKAGVNFMDNYCTTANKVSYVTTNKKDELDPEEEREYLKYAEYVCDLQAFINDSDIRQAIEEKDFVKSEDSIITITSFRNLLETNTLTFSDKLLTDKFVGFNRNEINVNMLLLYYLENRVNEMNKVDGKQKPIIHEGLEDLFRQVFEDTPITIYVRPGEGASASALPPPPKRGKMGGGGESDENEIEEYFLPNDLLDVLYDLLIDDDDTLFKRLRKNMYFLLHLPTKYEISAGNFQHHPEEIQTDIRNYITKKFQQLSEIQDRRIDTPIDSGLQFDRAIGVYGGKYKKRTIRRKRDNRRTHKPRKNNRTKSSKRRNHRTRQKRRF
jgi:hypothetical protein